MSTTSTVPFARVEDDALVRGRGRFVDDLRAPKLTFGWFVRSPHAHARIASIEVDAARRAVGVVAVLTGHDVAVLGVTSVSRHPPATGRGGAKLVVPHRPAIAIDKVMHVGEAVALVVADNLLAAQDAAELVEVDYDVLPALTDLQAAIGPGAPQLWSDAPGNQCLDWLGPVPDDGTKAAEIDKIF